MFRHPCSILAALLIFSLVGCDSQINHIADGMGSDSEHPVPDSADVDLPDSADVDLPDSADVDLPDSADVDLPDSVGADLPDSVGADLPDSVGADFLSLEVGDTWAYNYRYSSVSTLTYTKHEVDSGLVRLTVVERGCRQTTCVSTLQKEIQITKLHWTQGLPENDTTVTEINLLSEVQAVEFEDGLVQHPFFGEPIQRFHSTELDSVFMSKQTTTHLDASLGSVGNWLELTLTEEQGIEEARFYMLGSAAVNSGGSLRLVSGE